MENSQHIQIIIADKLKRLIMSKKNAREEYTIECQTIEFR